MTNFHTTPTARNQERTKTERGNDTMILPTTPLPADLALTGTNMLFVGDFGIGKSALLVSTGYLLGDPEDKLRAYSSLRVTLPDWKTHLEFRDTVAKSPKGTYRGIGLDTLNVSYNHCMLHVMKNVKFNGLTLNHPSENPSIAYPRVTHEFITWLTDMTLLGYHVVATCHANIIEIRNKQGSAYNRWIPGFVGGTPESTYGRVLRVFSIVGFMALEDVVKPSTAQKMGKAVVDVRADATRIDTEQRRVIHFEQTPNWLANNRDGNFPEEVVLPKDWREDWNVLVAAWGHGSNTVADEPLPLSEGLTAPAGTAGGLEK